MSWLLDDGHLRSVVIGGLIADSFEVEGVGALDVGDVVGWMGQALLGFFLRKTNLSRMRECRPNSLISRTWNGLSTLSLARYKRARFFPSHPQYITLL